MTPERHRQVQELFLRAVEIDERDRRQWLERACGTDKTLLERVTALLANDDTRTLVDVDASEPAQPLDASALNENVQPAAMQASSRFRWILRAVPRRGLGMFAAVAVLLPVIAYALIADRVLDRFKNNLRATSLSEGVDTRASAIRLWLLREQNIVQSWADSSQVRQLVAELAEAAATTSSSLLSAARQSDRSQTRLNEELEALAARPVRYAVWDRRLTRIAVGRPDRQGLGDSATGPAAERLRGVLGGRAEVFVMGSRETLLQGPAAKTVAPTLGIFVPVRDQQGTVFAAFLVYDSGVQSGLSDFIQSTRSAGSTDIEARPFFFDSSGALLINSPYDAELQTLEWFFNDAAGSQSQRRLMLRDPGVDLTQGEMPPHAWTELPLTKMARMAITEGDGFDVDGYRDMRGVTVAGAWRWLEEYSLGIGLEIEKDAVEPAIWLAQLQSWAMLSVLGIGLSFAGYSVFVIRRLRTQLDADHRIGPYVLERMVGEGGMGQVFLARHELLKRATAIKLLRPEVVSELSTARFQHEAQLAARLVHPNTVSVYDFGVSDDGRCYLVMEWIEGLTLDALISRDGALPIDRSLSILRQIAMSLREAHGLGLIHRDLKPQNVMVTQRGGESDVVKVLDFGLARDLFTPRVTAPSTSGLIAGSPRYMAPERWDPSLPAGPATDIYAFGCIAFYILTAEHAVQGDSIETICANALSQRPRPPSAQRSDSDRLPPWLDELTVHCLARDIAQRPRSFDEVLQRFPPVA